LHGTELPIIQIIDIKLFMGCICCFSKLLLVRFLKTGRGFKTDCSGGFCDVGNAACPADYWPLPATPNGEKAWSNQRVWVLRG
jgi:hypothetical protein